MAAIKSLKEFEYRLGKTNIAQIPRRKDLTKEEFTNTFFSKDAPVILEGWVNQWPAVQTLTPQFFKEQYPEVVLNTVVDAPETGSIGFLSLKDYIHPMPIPEVISLMVEHGKFCRVGDIPIHTFPGIETYCNFNDFMGHQNESKFMSIWIGGLGTRSSLHSTVSQREA